MTERTLVIIKPDAVRRGLVGTVLARYESKGFAFVALEQRTVDAAMADRHYADHLEQPWYPPLPGRRINSAGYRKESANFHYHGRCERLKTDQ